MKHIKILLFSLLSPFLFYAQEDGGAKETAGVEKSIFNIQTGTVGLWVSHEARLGNKFALRTEVGIDLWAAEAANQTETFFAPSISIEPRWYYNITKRAAKGRNTLNNSANFITVVAEYYPGMALGLPDRFEMPHTLQIIPKWGIRRAIAGSNWNYELGIGIGYEEFLTDKDKAFRTSDVGFDAHIRLGYTFK